MEINEIRPFFSKAMNAMSQLQPRTLVPEEFGTQDRDKMAIDQDDEEWAKAFD
jgi:hypothetical protein